MLHDRVEDLSSSQGAAIRYLLTAVSKNTLQTTLMTLEQFCHRSVEYHRFIIRAAFTAYLKSPSDERATIVGKLVAGAVEKPNGLTLLAPALDMSPSTTTKESLNTLLTTSLKLSTKSKMQVLMALQIGSESPGAKEAAAALLESLTLSQADLKDDRDLRTPALLARQMKLEQLSVQLAPACDVSLISPSSTTTRGRVSLASVLRELGTGCITTLADSRELLSIFPHAFTEKDVADVLAFFASQGTASNDANTYNALMRASGKSPSRNASGSSSVVNAMPLLDALQQEGKFNWDNVIDELDRPGAPTFRTHNISVIFEAYHRFRAENEYPSIKRFLGRWTNVARQRAALEYILKHPDKVNLKALKQDAPAELLPSVKPASVTAAELELWRSFAFVEAAVHVASRDREFEQNVLLAAAQKLPLLFLYTLFLGNFTGTIKNFTLIKHLLTSHCPALEGVSTHLLPEAAKANQLDSVISIFSELTETQPDRTVDVLEMVLRCKPVVKRFLTSSGSPRLAVAIAMCMDEVQEPSDKWIHKALEGKLHFRTSATDNRFSVAMCIVEVSEMLLQKQLYPVSATAALNTLIASPMKDMLKDVVDCARTLLAATDSLFPEDVEQKATSFFKNMYAEGNTVKAVAAMQKLGKSSSPQDKQLFACVLNILFEECSAVACYPMKELQLFAQLYGQLIAMDILPVSQQQRAWALLLPAAAKPANYAMEEYSAIALEQIKPRLPDWPQYCRTLRYVKDLDFKVPGIMAAIHRGIRQEESARSGNNNNSTGSPGSIEVKAGSVPADPAVVSVVGNKSKEPGSPTSKLHTLDIGTLLTSKSVTAPPRVIQEQINFLIGNTDMHNIENNARELSQLLRPEYYEYFADYLVVKRAALEPNYHAMYIELVSNLQFRGLDVALRAATTAAVKRLLLSEKIRSDCDDPSERILLRNLGSWLGNITLEKNIPILQSDMSFKDLIFSGLHDGKLMAVVAFIARVLQSSKNSQFFRAPNPWTMAQLGLLLELYNLPHLRDTLRFEVELLCRNLEVSLAAVDLFQREHFAPTRNERTLTDVYKEVDITTSSDFRVQEGKSGLPDTYQRITPVPAGAAGLRASSRPLQASAEPFQPKDVSPSSAGLVEPQVVAPASTPASNLDNVVAHLHIPHPPRIDVTQDTVVLEEGEDNPQNRHVLAMILANSVEKTLKAEAQRSVGVAVHTTFQFLSKDFARDPDPQNILTAGEAMVRTLTASLCNVSVREPLSMRMHADIVETLPSVKAREDAEVLVTRLVEKNMPLCQRVIESCAGEQAAKMLRERLIPSIQARAEAAATNTTVPLPGDQVNCGDFISMLGEELVPSGRMPASHMNVYTDFYSFMPCVVTFVMHLRSLEESVTRYHSSEPHEVLDLNDEKFFSAPVAGTESLRDRLTATMELITPATAYFLLNPLLSRLMRVTVTLDELTKERNTPRAETAAAATTTVTLGPDGKPLPAAVGAAAAGTERKHLTRNIHVANFMSQIFLMLLQACVQRGGDDALKELTRLYCLDERRFMFPKLTGDLLRIHLLLCPLFDKDLSQALLRGDKGTMNFVRELLNIVVVRQRLVSTRDVQNTLAVLDQIARSRHNPRQAAQVSQAPANVVTQPLSKLLPSEVTKLVMPPTSDAPEDPEREALVRRLTDEWNARFARMKNHRHSNEERSQSVDFVKTLQKEGMLDNPNLAPFFRLSIRLCIEHYATAALELERENVSYTERAITGERLGAPPAHHTPYSAKLFTKCDGFTELVFVLLRCCSLRGSESSSRDQQRAETTLLKRVLDVLYRVITSHHDWVSQNRTPTQALPAGSAYLTVFQQQPYVRLLSNIIVMIHRQDTASHKEMSEEMLMAVQSLLHRLHPLEYPGFAFGWMELVAHRLFIPHYVESPERHTRYTELLVTACRFVEFLTRGNAISGNGFVFYKTVFKLFLLLLHDFPSYLTSQHLALCDAIPSPCDQLINLVMCAFPSDMSSFSPFDHMPSDAEEMQRAVDTQPQQAYIQHVLQSNAGLAELISNPAHALYRGNESISVSYMTSVRDKLLQRAPADANTPVHWTLMNATVLQVAIHYLAQNNGVFDERRFHTSNVMQLFQFLCANFDTRHRYFFLRALALQLRYPNVQTNLFANVFFNLFLSTGDVDPQIRTATQEQITRVLGEKAMTSTPHPWGTLNTFVELMHRPEFHFWEHSFVHAEGLQQQVFDKLRKSIMSRFEQIQRQQQR